VPGIGEDEGVSAGIYTWPSVDAAKKAHDEQWREGVKARTGGYPTSRYFVMDRRQRYPRRELTCFLWNSRLKTALRPCLWASLRCLP